MSAPFRWCRPWLLLMVPPLLRMRECADYLFFFPYSGGRGDFVDVQSCEVTDA